MNTDTDYTPPTTTIYTTTYNSPIPNLLSRLKRGRNTRQKGATGGPATGKQGWKRRPAKD